MRLHTGAGGDGWGLRQVTFQIGCVYYPAPYIYRLLQKFQFIFVSCPFYTDGKKLVQGWFLQGYARRLINNSNNDQVCKKNNKSGRVIPHLTDKIWQPLGDYMLTVSPLTRWLQAWGEREGALSRMKHPRQRQNFVYTSERPLPQAAPFLLRLAESRSAWQATLFLSELTMITPLLCSS